MKAKYLASNAFVAILGSLCAYAPSFAADALSFETGSGNQTEILRFGIQRKFQSQWWKSNGSHIGGYWDLTLARWHGKRFQSIPGNSQNLWTIGITPVFRFQNDSLKGAYIEGGIGAHLLSEVYDNNDRKLSTAFQFGDHLGIGYVFQNNLDLGLKFQHFSNGSIKKPNDGVNFMLIRVSYPF